MKTIKHLSLGMLSAFLLWGCSSDEPGIDPLPPERGEKIKFAIEIANNPLKTRVATDSDFKSSFEAGDKIGLFAVKREVNNTSATLQASGNFIHNAELTCQDDGTWKTAEDLYYAGEGAVLDFYAYYPYHTGATNPTNMSFEVQTDQSDATDFSESDLMSAQAMDIVKDNAVSLSFEHLLAMVQINVIKGKGISDFDDNLEVSLENLQYKTTLNLKDNQVSTETSSSHSIKMYRLESTRTYRALVPTQTVSNGSTLFFFNQTTLGATINLEYTTDDDVSFSKGNAMLYRDIILNGENAPIYQIGDPYPDTEHAIGIVFETSNGGRNGKIVSLYEHDKRLTWSTEDENTGATNAFNGRKNMNAIAEYIAANDQKWSNFPAFEWVHGKNDATTDYSDPDAKGIWYLPAIDELDALYLVYNEDRGGFNTSLTAAGGTALSSYRYWSSSEYFGAAWYFNFADGHRNGTSKHMNLCNVRCVSAF